MAQQENNLQIISLKKVYKKIELWLISTLPCRLRLERLLR